jgi:hypothetical protein
MSVTFSEVVAGALRELAGRDGMAGRRIVLSELYGLDPGAIFDALANDLPATAAVRTGNRTHQMSAADVSSGRLLLPYLVDENRSGPNSGSAGFAATLRTQFLDSAPEERVLLIFDPRPVETVLSAAEDAAAFALLGWDRLTLRALEAAASHAGIPHPAFAERVVHSFHRHRQPGPDAFRDLAIWLERNLPASDTEAGRNLFELGCFLSDPGAAADPSRLEQGALLRRQLDERFASRSKLWEAEVRKLLGRRGTPAEVIDKVIASAGPFAVRYARFELGELLQNESTPQPLRTDQYDPVAGARASLREGDALVAWLPADATTLTLRLQTPALGGDKATARWTGSSETELELVSGRSVAVLELPAGAPWLFGVLELRRARSSGAPSVTEELQLAIHRSDLAWFPVEDALAVDASEAAFLCEQEPVAVAYGEDGEPLGRCTHAAVAAEDAGTTQLAVTFRGETTTLPVLLVGEAEEEDPVPPEPPDDPEDPPPPPDEQAEYPSVPHALLAAGRDSWPDASTSKPEGDTARQVQFRIGARQLKVAAQRPSGIDGALIERAILEHPEWISYVWSGTGASLARAPGAVLTGGSLPEHAVSRFTAARSAFFAAAADRGSVYALDPGSSEVAEYIDAYGALIGEVPREARYLADWDALLLCDSVLLAGRREILIAPTSPLAAAFHAALAVRLAGWTGAGDVPPAQDVQALSLTHAAPLLHVRDQWYETAPLTELLWRRYVPLSADAPGVPERNAKFIAQRIRFFLQVHSAYRRPDQILTVAFHQPGDGRVVFDALREFYRKELKESLDHDYALPKLHVCLVGGDPQLAASVSELLGGGRQDDLDRLVQTRITVTTTALDQPPGFAHITFLFRSPGYRGPRQVQLHDRPPTAHLDALAAAPGRLVYAERNKVFAWGTWAPADGAHSAYHKLLSRGLELAGGQPTGKLNPGWTQMASTSVDQQALDELYQEHSVWVVHLDRLIGIEAFGNTRQLIEYEERADPDQPGYDGITATEQLTPYLEAVGRALSALGEPSEVPLRRILQMLNAVSGRWAIELLQREDNDILQRVGFVAAIALIEQLEGCLGTTDHGTGVLVALDELIAGRPHAGLPRFSLPVPLPEGKMCDDLLLLWVPAELPDGSPLTVHGAVIEVKYATRGRASTDEARGEIERTRKWLDDAFNTQGSSRPFRARDLSELISAAAARASTFQLGRPIRPEMLDPALRRIVDGDYKLELAHWRGKANLAGMIVSVEAESTVATNQGSLGDTEPVDVIRVGRPILRQLVAGTKLRPAGPWDPLRFSPADSGPPAPPETARPDEPPRPPPASAPPDAPSPGPSAPGKSVTPRAPEQAAAGEVAAVARALDAAMEKYRLAAEPFRPDLADVGPNVIRFRTRPLGPLSVNDIERRARDLGREVGAPGGVIVSQEPLYICVDVPRSERQPVLYTDLVPHAPVGGAPGALDFIVGVAPSGDVRGADLARLPHLLVAGATGSGKSVFLRAMLCHLVRTHGPAALRILLIDPKGLDFAGFASLPHLETGRIISDAGEAVDALQATIERELDRRRPILVDAGVTSATEFYERGGAYEQLPQMVVLVDEFADLAAVMERQERRGFQELIQRYAQVTRAFGIYLVLATQRPSVDVITGAIKANLTARVALSLPSHRDSMTVLDRAGAEDLLGNGDLLFYVNGGVERLQGALATPTDVAHAAERWRGVDNPGSS